MRLVQSAEHRMRSAPHGRFAAAISRTGAIVSSDTFAHRAVDLARGFRRRCQETAAGAGAWACPAGRFGSAGCWARTPSARSPRRVRSIEALRGRLMLRRRTRSPCRSGVFSTIGPGLLRRRSVSAAASGAAPPRPGPLQGNPASGPSARKVRVRPRRRCGGRSPGDGGLGHGGRGPTHVRRAVARRRPVVVLLGCAGMGRCGG